MSTSRPFLEGELASSLAADAPAISREIVEEFDGCRLCWALSESGQRHAWNAVLWGSDEFVLMPTLGAFLDGWVLFTSRAHVLSAALLPEPQLASLQLQLEDVIRSLGVFRRTWAVFEHGSTKCTGPSGCCVEHLHFHLVALDWDLAASVGAALSVPTRGMDALQELAGTVGRLGTNYIMVRNPDGQYFCLLAEVIPSQLVRQILAAHSHRSGHWDWRRHPLVEQTIAGAARIQAALSIGSIRERV